MMMHRFFLKRLRRQLTVLLLPIVTLAAVITVFAGNSITKNIREQEASSVDAIDNIFRSITSACFTQQNIMTLNTSLALSMKRVLQNEKTYYSDYVYMNSINSFLRSSAAYSPCIDSIYLYLDSYDAYYSSEKTICHLGTADDSDWYSSYQAMPADAATAVIARKLTRSEDSSDTLTVFQRLSYLKGVVVGNLSISELQKSFARLLPTCPCSFFVTDRSGDVLMQVSGEGEAPLKDVRRFPVEESDAGGFRYTRYGTGLQASQLCTEYNADLDLYYVIAVPRSYIAGNILSELLLLLVITVCMVTGAIFESYRETRANFDQIHHVITLFDDAEKGIYPAGTPARQPRNEYDLIMNNIITLFLNTTFLNSQLAEQKYQKKAAELTALQLQINPHFMINTLQSLSFEIFQRSGATSSEYRIIRNLSDILQYSLAKPGQSVTVSDEVDNIHKYIAIQKYRFPDSFIYYEEIDDAALEIPFQRLLLQPLIENSISHGIRPSGKKGLIKLRIYVRENVLHVSVVDSGVGMDRQTLEKVRRDLETEQAERIGLSNVNRRLILTYGEESRLRILSKAGWGTAVSFMIRIRS